VVRIEWEDLAAPGVQGSIGQVRFGSAETVLYRDRVEGHIVTAHYDPQMGYWTDGPQAWWIVEHAPTDRADSNGTPVRRSQFFATEAELKRAWDQVRGEQR